MQTPGKPMMGLKLARNGMGLVAFSGIVSTLLLVYFGPSVLSTKPWFRDAEHEVLKIETKPRSRSPEKIHSRGGIILRKPTSNKGNPEDFSPKSSFRNISNEDIRKRGKTKQPPDGRITPMLHPSPVKVADAINRTSSDRGLDQGSLPGNKDGGLQLYDGVFVPRTEVRKDLLTSGASYMKISRKKPAGSIPLHELSQSEPFRSRLEKMENACGEYPDGNFTDLIDLMRLAYDDKHKVIMCVIPKAACTTWKTMMFYLMGRSSLENAFKVPSSYLVLNFGKMKSMARLSREGILRRLNTYTKFMVTRHPYSRLVSAHKNKFTGYRNAIGTSHKYISIAREMARKAISEYLPGVDTRFMRKSGQQYLRSITSHPSFSKLGPDKKKMVVDMAIRGFRGNLTFEEFIKFGVVNEEQASRNYDIHWRPQHVLCNPCAVKYDYVIRFEHLESESVKLLDYIQKDDPKEKWIKFPGGRTPRVDQNNTPREFFGISTNLRSRLRKVYDRDFRYFSYDPTII